MSSAAENDAAPAASATTCDAVAAAAPAAPTSALADVLRATGFESLWRAALWRLRAVAGKDLVSPTAAHSMPRASQMLGTVNSNPHINVVPNKT